MSLYRTGGGGKTKFASITVKPNESGTFQTATFTLTAIPNYKDMVLNETMFIDPSYGIYTTASLYGAPTFTYNAETGVVTAKYNRNGMLFWNYTELTVHYAV